MNISKINSSDTFRAKVTISEKLVIDKLSPTEKELQELRTLIEKAKTINDGREISFFYGSSFDRDDNRKIEYENNSCGLCMKENGDHIWLSDFIYKISNCKDKSDSVRDENAFSFAILEPLRKLYNGIK